MPLINLRKYYYGLYKEDTFIEVTEDVANELVELRRYEDRKNRRMFRYKAYFSLDAGYGIEKEALEWNQPSPEELMLKKEEEDHHALMLKRVQDSFAVLTPIQARRMKARYLDKRILKDIAADEGVSLVCISKSISGSLLKLKKYFDTNGWTLRMQ
jgi:hypothetical protein